VPENAAVLAADSARTVLGELASHARTHNDYVTAADFKGWINEIKAATGVKGMELFNPVRIALTGADSGPLFDKLIPLIEDAAALGLGVTSVRERIERFVGV
jgi:glutamyl/glutaminyl-tRNA synthetase